jgi:virginiamycin B lyase
MKKTVLMLAACAGPVFTAPAFAGGSNYGIVPGALPQVQGKVTEWPVPTPKFARDPAPGPDGNLYIAVMSGNRIARFDTKTKTFKEWDLPDGARPHGLLVDSDGIVWYTGNGNGTIGRLDPATGQITHLDTGSGSRPRRVATAPDGMLWVTLYGNGKLIKVDPQARRIVKEYAMPHGRGAGPYAVTVDAAGRVWANEIDTDTVAILDPKTEAFRVIALPSKNTGIRKAIVDAQGRFWYMGSHNGKLGVIE